MWPDVFFLVLGYRCTVHVAGVRTFLSWIGLPLHSACGRTFSFLGWATAAVHVAGVRTVRNDVKNVRGVFEFRPIWTVDVPYSSSEKPKTCFLGTARACTGAPVIVSETLGHIIRRATSG